MKDSETWIQKVNDPAQKCSKWLRQGLNSALTRDPLEALNDAMVLHQILEMQWKEIKRDGKFK